MLEDIDMRGMGALSIAGPRRGSNLLEYALSRRDERRRRALDWEEYQQILNERTFKDASFSEAELRSMVDEIKFHDVATLLERNRDGGGLEVWLTDIKAYLEQNDLPEQDFDPQAIFQNEAILKALEEVGETE